MNWRGRSSTPCAPSSHPCTQWARSISKLASSFLLEPSLDSLGSNLWDWEEQDGLLEWLDGHSPSSVVYVNYGSTTVMTKKQLLEFAWGLADSGYPFIWNIRPDLVKGDTSVLPPEFMSCIRDRSMLSTWCSQEKVITHEAVGVFLTHSGWNSTLESIGAGVPMLSWPFFGEQQTNCRYKCTEWGNGMEIGGEVKRKELASLIREVIRMASHWIQLWACLLPSDQKELMVTGCNRLLTVAQDIYSRVGWRLTSKLQYV